MSNETGTPPVSQGTCNLCGKTFAKGGMTRHLKTCLTKQATAPASGKSTALVPHYHLVVQGRHASAYWLHLAVSANTTLRTLDEFLRNIWLECCGHLSEFTIGETHYASTMEPGFGGGWLPLYEERSMRVALNKVLPPGSKAAYEYDFGTTTELIVSVMGEYRLPRTRAAIQVLARNEAPVIGCDGCGATATQICTQCIWEGEGWLCGQCAASHECGEEMLLPVVNSPRVGMCAYTG